MVVAVAKALEAGARAIVCASTGNTSASAAAYGAAAGLEVVVVLPEGPDRARQAAPGADRRRAGRRGRRQLRPGARDRPRAGRAGRPPDHARQLRQPVPARGPEDRRLRDLRRPRAGARTSSPSRSATPATSAPTGPASATTAAAGLVDDRAADVRLPGGRRRADRPRPPGRASPRRSPPRSGSATRRRGTRRSRPATSRGGRIEAVTDDEILAAYRDLARLEGVFCEPASAASVAGHRAGWPRPAARPRRDRRVRADRARPQGPDTAERQVPRRPSRPRRRSARSPSRWAGERGRMVAHWLAELDGRRVTVEVPATSANLGAGYDCLGVALEPDQPGRARGPRLESRRDRADGRRRGRRTSCRPTATNRFVRGLEAALAAGRGELPDGVGWRIDDAQPDPAGAGPRLLGRGDDRRPRGGNALLRRTARDRRTCCGWRPRSRAIPTTSRRRCWAASSSRTTLGEAVEAIRFDVPRDLRAVLFIPDLRLDTRDARGAAGDGAVRRRGREPGPGRARCRRAGDRRTTSSAFSPGSTARAVPRRGLPAAARLVEAAREAGAIGACLSGAGSTVLAFADTVAAVARIEAAFSAAAADTDTARTGDVVTPRNTGAKVVHRG